MKFRIKKVKIYPDNFVYYVEHKYKFWPFWFNSLDSLYLSGPCPFPTYEKALEMLNKFKKYKQLKNSEIIHKE